MRLERCSGLAWAAIRGPRWGQAGIAPGPRRDHAGAAQGSRGGGSDAIPGPVSARIHLVGTAAGRTCGAAEDVRSQVRRAVTGAKRNPRCDA
ncbi:Uncharacterised protein [Mycobacteroides abscessus subsp. abscessus]|nr:Uncharacterised protein [Mycobacteroides abscessus subsp. abscessus]